MSLPLNLCQWSLKIFFSRPRKHLGERTTTIFIKNSSFPTCGSGFSLVYVFFLKWCREIGKTRINFYKIANLNITKQEGVIFLKLDSLCRSIFFISTFLLELLFFSFSILTLCHSYPWLSVVFSILSWSCVLWLLSSEKDPSYKISWLFLLLPFPVLGWFYFLRLGGFAQSQAEKKIRGILKKQPNPFLDSPQNLSLHSLDSTLPQPENLDALEKQLHYFQEQLGYSAFRGCATTYFPSGEAVFPTMKEQLLQAKHYIFLEYFIIDHGLFWGDLLDILKEKSRQGVEVRILYDDIGCFFFLPKDFIKKLQVYHIKAQKFHPLSPLFSSRLNQRNHRKLMIVDGLVGFTGGINLADQYINQKNPFGYWKDSVLMVEGAGVWAMTSMFLAMWEYSNGCEENISPFLPEYSPFFQESGLVLLYNEIPLSGDSVAQRVFLNLLWSAKKYIYITSPYLILDTTTETLLCQVAQNGIDVRLITPGIPDKKFVFQVTQQQYPVLLESGVKIYQFSSGFIHGKNVIVDDVFATVSSINLDYRSLFLHFEHGVWMYDTPCIVKMKDDFLATLEQSVLMTMENHPKHWGKKLLGSILRIFSPFM